MSFFRRALDYLGLSGEESYDDYDMSAEYERPARAPRASDPLARRAPEPEYSSETTRPRGMRVDDTGAARRPDDSSGIQVRPVGAPRNAPSVRTVGATGETVTVRPRDFNQAKEIGDCFKDGVPVIVNLESADREMSRRIIDFASGLCYALGGTMEKVATGVYLLKPTFDGDR